MADTCLFLINGLGMGNSTRCHAVIRHLILDGMEVHVLTSGNGLVFFRDKPGLASLHEMESFFYSVKSEQLSIARTLGSVGDLATRALRKKRQLEDLLHEIRPDIAVTDSEYTIHPLKRRGIPVVALNNSDVVVSEYLRQPHVPRPIRPQFWCIEFLDYLFHRTFVRAVISPSPRPLPPRHPRIRGVGLIVRPEILEIVPPPGTPRILPREAKTLVFMLSGSTLGSRHPLPFHTLPYRIEVIGREGPSDAQVTYHGKVVRNVEILKRADILVINAGFSAVSEALALRTPCFVVPIPNHAEQYVNALHCEQAGIGYLTDEAHVIEKILACHRANEWIGLPDRPGNIDLQGAEQAANVIREVLQQDRQS